jgi:hypothetical protein
MTQLPLAAAQPHRNQQLFSDYYLNVILPQRPDWQMLADAAAPVLAELLTLWQSFTPSSNEAQTENELIRPVLLALGHSFEVQPALVTPDGTKRPDYVFYRDAAALTANKGRTLDDTLPQGGGLAVGDAKYWDRPLDLASKGSGGDFFSNKNPSYQIAFYIQYSGVEWGLLTNGRRWRLYHRDTAHKFDRFYEVDLPMLLEAQNPESFLYFYAFFRRAAFDDHPLGVAALLRASRDYARGVSDSLKRQVYDALRHLAQGFLDYAPNGLTPDPPTLATIYNHALIVLYRLLFVFYAEARELLPVRASQLYRDEYSLYAISRDVERKLRLGTHLLPTSATIWPRLLTLFNIINQGSPPLKVATFNGGLFDPQRYPFLEQQQVGDAHLLAALDRLARVDGQFIDYRDLAERHLGTIYEGLLEYHLEPIPPAEGWSVDLLNDRGERKATGSFYTPDFIVKYIVDATVGPVLRAAVKDAPDAPAQIAAVLAVNVLDPAMGSGHFLVETTEYIARFLVDLGISRGDEPVTPGDPLPIASDTTDWSDLAYWKRRVAQSCIYGVDLNPLAVDLAKLALWLTTVAQDKPLSFLDHHLRCGNALVGTRIDQLETSGSGAKKRQRKEKTQNAKRKTQNSATQISMLDDEAFRRSMSSAVGSMWLIERTAGNTVDEVKEQERVYADLRETLTRRYGRLAHLATATHFGVEFDPTFWNVLTDYASGRALTVPRQLQAWLEAADALAATRRFFHWELEFPEVFFDQHGYPLGANAGFDAVVGNPPYVRQEDVGPFKPYFAAAYPQVYHGVADLYVYFYQQGLQALRQGGRMAYIVTNKWMRAGYGEPLREYFTTHAALEQIIDFGHAPIFPDADVFPCIVVLKKPDAEAAEQVAAQQVQVTAFPREALKLVQIEGYVRRYSHPVPQRRLGRAAWSLETSEVDRLLAKIRQTGVPLAEFAGVKPYRGLLTGLNEAFLVNTQTKEKLIKEDPQCKTIIKPFLRGQDIKRWSPDWNDLWIILLQSSINQTWPWSEQQDNAEAIFAQTFPSIYKHFAPLKDKLQRRQDKGRYWWELRSCAYYEVFEQTKLMYQEIQFHPSYCLDTDRFLSNNKVFILPANAPYVLAVLNSPLMWWHNWRHLPHMKDEALSPVAALMETLPIAPPTDALRAEVEPAVEQLIAITRANQEARRDTLDWLRTEFDIEKPGQKLEAFAALSSDAFIAEVRKRRPKGAGPLKPAALKALREGYADLATPVQQRQATAQQLERRLADLVNAAYGLTPEEVELLWQSAPPRMPGGRTKN